MLPAAACLLRCPLPVAAGWPADTGLPALGRAVDQLVVCSIVVVRRCCKQRVRLCTQAVAGFRCSVHSRRDHSVGVVVRIPGRDYCLLLQMRTMGWPVVAELFETVGSSWLLFIPMHQRSEGRDLLDQCARNKAIAEIRSASLKLSSKTQLSCRPGRPLPGVRGKQIS